MPITERFTYPMTDIGQFSIPLEPDVVSGEVLEMLDPFGHVVVLDQHIGQPDEIADVDLLATARYAGVLLESDRSEEGHHLRGAGMAWHLGDASGVGAHLAGFTFTSAVPSTVLSSATGMLAPTGIITGTITDTSVAGYGNGTVDIHKWDLAHSAIRAYLLTVEGVARVNHNGTLDMSLSTLGNVYALTPSAVAVRHGWGSDPILTGVHANQMRTRRDSTQFLTGAFSLDSSGALFAAASLEYSLFDIHGAELIRELKVEGLADGTAQAEYLDQVLKQRGPAFEADIDTEQWSIQGEFGPGDLLAVYSPEDGFVDFTHETHFRGQVIWPMWCRVVEWTWYLTQGQGVYYRPSFAGVTSADWIDLTRFVKWEGRGGETKSRLVLRAVVPGVAEPCA